MITDQARPATAATLQAFCVRLGYRPEEVARITLLPDAIVVDCIRMVDGRLLEWTERRPL